MPSVYREGPWRCRGPWLDLPEGGGDFVRSQCASRSCIVHIQFGVSRPNLVIRTISPQSPSLDLDPICAALVSFVRAGIDPSRGNHKPLRPSSPRRTAAASGGSQNAPEPPRPSIPGERRPERGMVRRKHYLSQRLLCAPVASLGDVPNQFEPDALLLAECNSRIECRKRSQVERASNDPFHEVHFCRLPWSREVAHH